MKHTLENVTIPNPCPIDWDTMRGGSEVRVCDSCQHKVFNISEMPKRRALKVLNQPETSICISYYRDEQNQIVTQSYAAVFKRNVVKAVGAMLALLISFSPLYAVQVKPKPKRKKVVKQRTQKKSQVNQQKRVVGPARTSKKRLTGLLQ